MSNATSAGAQTFEQTRHPGIRRVHSRECPAPERRCRCEPRYQAAVWSARERKRIRKHFDSEKAAAKWRRDTASALENGTLAAPSKRTVKQAADALIEGMRDRSILDRSGHAYKPSTVRGYETSLRLRILPVIGSQRLSTLDRRIMQSLVERWRREGLAPSSVRNALNPLQVLCRRAVFAGELAIDPTEGLQLPAGKGRRERVATAPEAADLLAALDDAERAVWGAAFYSGLRRGELQALRVSDIDDEAGLVHVRRSWDQHAGFIEVKTDAGLRSVPLIAPLRKLLAAHRLSSGRRGDDLVFGRTASDPFVASTVRSRALAAWEAENARRTKAADGEKVELLEPIGLHESRHTFASFLYAAKLGDLELATYLGHSDVRTTKSIYTHLFGGHEERSAKRIDDYFEAQAGGAR